jgi:formaldehyde-activating enzyme
MMGVAVGNSRHPIMPGGAFRREDREELRGQLEALGKIGRVERAFDLGNKMVKSQYPAVPYTPDRFEGFTLKVGEGFAGPPFQELAHIDLLLGVKDGPVGRAIERALSEERPGHDVEIITERPRTLLVPTVTVRTAKQRRHVYEEAAKGVAQAIEADIAAGVLPEDGLDDLCMIANVFVHPAAAIRQRIYFNNYKAMRAAVRKALEGRPTLEELINEKEAARHPFRYAP